MGRYLRLLIIEDVEDHALLLERELQKGGFKPQVLRVETLPELEAALDEGEWDAVISDFSLPGFNGLDALRMIQQKGRDLPFLLISGAIGEERAAEVMKAGAHDYIRKGNYARLAAVVERELQDAQVRRERKRAAEELARQGESLELLVQQRTEELVKANVALEVEVAERRRAEEALSQSEEMLRFAALAADIGMWHYDLLTGDLVWSDRCKDLFGYPHDFTMTYQAFLDAIAEEDRQRVHQAVQRALQEKSQYAVELRVLLQDGQVRWVMSKGHAFYDQQGKPLRMAGIALDITQRKQTEAALLRAKEEWESTFNSVPDLIAILDEKCRIVRVNEAMAQRVHLEADRCVGLFCYQVLHGENAPPHFCPHGQSLADKTQHTAEVYDPHLTGTFLVSTTPLVSADGKSIGTVHVARDITERKRAEEEIARLNADLEAHLAEQEERNQELDAFNRMISHDLRQPLNIMSLACQHIEMLCSSDNEDCRRSVQTLEQSVFRMNAMIETLLSFSRSTHGDLLREEFDISEMVQVILAELNLAEPARRITSVIQEGVKVYADPHLLRTALENLLGNAWKYTGSREEGYIEFGVKGRGVKPVYFIKDNGVGFDMADADKLFVPFQRLAGAGAFKGSGIGLATVEKIIKRHGGRIWAEGEPDKGAVFYFTLES